MKKIDFSKIAINTVSAGVGGVAGVEIDNFAGKMPIPKPFIQMGKIAASIAAIFFMPKNEMVANVAAGMIGQSSAELYKQITKRGGIGALDEIFVNENGVRTDAYGNPVIIDGVGYTDAQGNEVDENGLIGSDEETEEVSGYNDELISATETENQELFS